MDGHPEELKESFEVAEDSMNRSSNTAPDVPRSTHQYRHPFYPSYPPPVHSNSEPLAPETESLMRGLPSYDSSHQYHYSSDYPRYDPHYHCPPSYPAPSYYSIQSEPPRYSRRHHSSPETYHSAQYASSHFDYHSRPSRWESPHNDAGAAHAYRYEHAYDASVDARHYDTAYAGVAYGHIPGTTPPQIGSEAIPVALDNVDVSGPFKTEEFALHPNEGFDSPPSHFDANLSADDDRKPASLPDYINLKDDQFTPSPEMGQYHESPTSIGNQPHPTEPAPPLPKLNNHAETINSDVANSSSNSSSHGASSSSGSDFGWMRHYQSLVEYKQREGTCEVPQKYKHGSLNLGVWVNKQRMERRKLNNGKRSSMSPNRLHKLNSIGFNWGKEKGQASWDQKYRELCEFKEKHGHTKVRTKSKTYKTLGRWVTSQRSDYKNDRLSQEKIDKLNELGFVWDYFKADKE